MIIFLYISNGLVNAYTYIIMNYIWTHGCYLIYVTVRIHLNINQSKMQYIYVRPYLLFQKFSTRSQNTIQI